ITVWYQEQPSPSTSHIQSLKCIEAPKQKHIVAKRPALPTCQAEMPAVKRSKLYTLVAPEPSPSSSTHEEVRGCRKCRDHNGRATIRWKRRFSGATGSTVGGGGGGAAATATGVGGAQLSKNGKPPKPIQNPIPHHQHNIPPRPMPPTFAPIPPLPLPTE